ncbi:hypothetical protein AB0G00_09980 [Nocardia salmonicida]|uniref:hypothetical protein n=1 Tax=Nocardia salmonicida TaxID=53431 RepID=UPI0033D0FA46
MSKTRRINPRRSAKRNPSHRRITVHGQQRTSPDLHKLGRAVIVAALAETEAKQAAASQNGAEEVEHDL